MNADHYYRIGKNHQVCEDYALSGVAGDFAYAIVCDGCSDSPDVDFGARALALAARETLRYTKAVELSVADFGSLTVLKASTMGITFPLLHPQTLDSTLLVAWVRDGAMTVFMYGDGVLIHRNHRSVRCVHVDISTGAPDYLAYHLDAKRKDGYLALGGTKQVYDCIMDGSNFSGSDRIMKPLDPVVIRCRVAPGDVIAVCSDGMDSFRRPDNEAIVWRDLVDDYTGFLNYAGVFVQRHLAAFSRRCQKNLITHSDDISIAAIQV